MASKLSYGFLGPLAVPKASTVSKFSNLIRLVGGHFDRCVLKSLPHPIVKQRFIHHTIIPWIDHHKVTVSNHGSSSTVWLSQGAMVFTGIVEEMGVVSSVERKAVEGMVTRRRCQGADEILPGDKSG